MRYTRKIKKIQELKFFRVNGHYLLYKIGKKLEDIEYCNYDINYF